MIPSRRGGHASSGSRRKSLLLRALPPPGHYSVQKFLDLHVYVESASRWRVACAIFSTPLPGLVAALVPAFLPVRPLHEGPTAAFYAHAFFIVLFVTSGAVMSTLVVTGVPASTYSMREVGLVAICSGIVHLIPTYALPRFWGFPTPFLWVVGTCVLFFSASIAHLVVLRRKCWQKPELARAVRVYGVGLLIQVLQVAIYPAVSVLFDHVNTAYQIGITLLFPLLKIVIKRSLKYVTRGLHDQHGVVVVAAVEICSSMYQSMIMQSAPSTVALVVIMALDVVQSFMSIKLFLDRPCDVPKDKLAAEALQVIQANRRVSAAKKSKHSWAAVAPLDPAPTAPALHGPTSKDLPRANTESRVAARRRLIRQAMQATHVAETLLLVEYFEVIVPLINCAFLAVAAQLRSAFYNTKLREFYGDPGRLKRAVASILLYSLLQGLSYVAMHLTMKYRYGLSATYHLAFVLERHRVPIQGKMVAWLPVILHFTSVHYGTDFSFQFDFEKWEQW